MGRVAFARSVLVVLSVFVVLLTAESAQADPWSIQATSGPPGSADSALSAVSCVSASSCIAVGNYATTSRAGAAVAAGAFSELWNGTAWTIEPVPPIGHGTAALNSVSCTSATFCVAVGAEASGGQHSVAVVEMWDGAAWRVVVVAAPRVRGSRSRDFSLSGISCISPRSCVAVGSYGAPTRFTYSRSPVLTPHTLAEVWDGNIWRTMAAATLRGVQYAMLASVSCSARNACTAVGTYFPGGSDTLSFNGSVALAERWNGRRWTVQHLPALPQDGQFGREYVRFDGVSCPSGSYCLAVGAGFGGQGPGRPIAAQWDGRRWRGTHLALARLDGGDALSVSCASVEACTAVGDFDPQAFIPPGGFVVPWTTELLVQAWNGTGWTTQAVQQLTTNSENPVAAGLCYLDLPCAPAPALSGVSCIASTECFAVGAVVGGGTLAESETPAAPTAVA